MVRMKQLQPVRDTKGGRNISGTGSGSAKSFYSKVLLLCASLYGILGVLQSAKLFSLFSSTDIASHDQNTDVTNRATQIPMTAFDSALQMASARVAKQQQDQRAGGVSGRKKFNLSTWDRKTQGGLYDLDRIKLAELYSNAESVFEWGLGESSYIAAEVGVPRYGGIDSDAAWIQAARDKSPDHFRFHLGDIGPTSEWGRPQRKRLPKAYLNYQFGPLLSEVKPFDVYMVDGRMRPACALIAFLHASATASQGGTHGEEGKSSPIVLVHDYYDAERSANCTACRDFKWGRPYHRLEEVADLVDHSGAMLAVFERKPNVTDQDSCGRK